jgi:hypothetical protein
MTLVLRPLLLAALLAVPAVARAGDFVTTCNFQSDALKDCGSNFADIVTDRFIERFPADRFEIFVFSNVTAFDEGGMIAYAAVGVVPLGSHQFPQLRFLTSRAGAEDKRYTAAELGENERDVARDAVQSLMDQCAKTEACAVYAPWAAPPPVE